MLAGGFDYSPSRRAVVAAVMVWLMGKGRSTNRISAPPVPPYSAGEWLRRIAAGDSLKVKGAEAREVQA